MLADGIGDPGMIGDQDQDDAAAGPAAAPAPGDQSDPGMPPIIKPEAVMYHDDPQSCQSCQYMSDEGQCAVLQMAVSPEGGCTAFEAKADDQGAGDPGLGGQPGEDNGGGGEGTSASFGGQ